MKLREIAEEAAKLTEEERASLASQLLRGLEAPVHQVSDEEVLRRMEEAENDPAVLLTYEQLLDGLVKRGA